MRRYPAYDPPEYVHWTPDTDVLKEYRTRLTSNPQRRKILQTLTTSQLLDIYRGLLKNRLHDIALKRWVKLGIISKAWLGTGEEAATIGPVHALDRSPHPDGTTVDMLSPMIRNAGACHEMGMPLADMLRGYLATGDSPTRGRDLHIGSMRNGVVPTISHVGELAAVCNGIALRFKMRGERRVVLNWIGDGSTKAGVFHEALNFAAVKKLPIIFIIQNNRVALGTRLEQHHKGDFADWPASYGVYGDTFDGNNVLDAYAATRLAVDRVRAGCGPALLIAETFRMGGHATHDEEEARRVLPASLFEYWGRRDPIGCYEEYLITSDYNLADSSSPSAHERRASNRRVLEAIEESVIAEVDRSIEEALESRNHPPRPESAVEGVYA